MCGTAVPRDMPREARRDGGAGMQFFEIWMIGIGLSMDAFAVSLCRGTVIARPTPKQYLSVALWFGGFQALMPLLGYRLGAEFGLHLRGVNHIFAFLILAVIGANMMREGLHAEPQPEKPPRESKTGSQAALARASLFLLAVATSIDAFAVGVSFGVMGGVPVAAAAAVIGLTAALLSAVGLFIGAAFGARSKYRAAFFGGVVLVLIGVKILLQGFRT